MRFYFDFVDGPRRTRDVDGQDMDGVEAVCAELLKALPEVLLFDPRPDDERRIDCDVRDERGEVVCRGSVILAVRASPKR